MIDPNYLVRFYLTRGDTKLTFISGRRKYAQMKHRRQMGPQKKPILPARGSACFKKVTLPMS